MTRKELLRSEDYIRAGIQLNILNMMEDYMKKNKLKRVDLSKRLGVSKGYISQIFSAEFNHKISKMVELSVACDKMPLVMFVDINDFIENDAKDFVYDLTLVQRPRNVTYSTTSNSIPFSHIQNKEEFNQISSLFV